MTICGDLISSAEDDLTYLKQRLNMEFPLQSIIEITMCNLENAIITMTEKKLTRQVKMQGHS